MIPDSKIKDLGDLYKFPTESIDPYSSDIAVDESSLIFVFSAYFVCEKLEPCLPVAFFEFNVPLLLEQGVFNDEYDLIDINEGLINENDLEIVVERVDEGRADVAINLCKLPVRDNIGGNGMMLMLTQQAFKESRKWKWKSKPKDLVECFFLMSPQLLNGDIKKDE